MHTLTVQTKYNFGDRVKFESSSQDLKGIGRIIAITIEDDRSSTYIVETVEPDGVHICQPGICDAEIICLVEREHA